MPAALERKLKREAAKDPSIKDKDAYVYGTLRKTGWKPSREKKKTKQMEDPSGLITAEARLQKLQFQYNPDDEQAKAGWSPRSALLTAGGIGVGAGGFYGGSKLHQAIQGSGGYGANLTAGTRALRYGPDELAKATGTTAGALGSKVGLGLRSAGEWGIGKAGSALSKLSKFFHLEDPRKPITFQYNPNRMTSVNPTGVNPGAGAKAVAGASGGLSNVQRSLANAPKGPGVSGAAGGFGKTATGIEKLKKFFNPATAAKLAIYESREQPQIFESAEDTLDFQTPVAQAIGPATKKVLNKIALLSGATIGAYNQFSESDDKIISLDEHLLEPWQGSMSKSKLLEEEFPAGLSPAAALRFPLPKIMRLLKARRPQLLQQQFPGFSRMGRLVELNSKLDEISFVADLDYENSTDRHKSVKQGAGIAIAGGGVGAAYLGHRAVMKRYGKVPTLEAGPHPAPGFQNQLHYGIYRQPSAVGPARVGAGAAYGSAVRDVSERAANRLRRASTVAGYQYRRARGFEPPSIGRRLGAAKKAVGGFISHLNAQLDDVIAFGSKKN